MIITESFIPENPYSRSGKIMPEIIMLVVHYVNNPGQSAANCVKYFADLAKQTNTKTARYGSAHYVIGLDGEIIQAIPEKEVAFHVGSSVPDPVSKQIYTDKKREICGEANPNFCSIGIEVCHKDATGEFGSQAMDSLHLLARDIILRYKLKRGCVVRHYDIVGWKSCPKFYVAHSEKWDAFLDDLFKVI